MALTRLPTSAITSGTFDNARISAGSVTQHVTATDLQPLKSDLSALALREATNESSAAFNLPNQFIDTFATDVLGTKTNVAVDSGGYAASAVEGTATELDYFTPTQAGGGTADYTLTTLGKHGGDITDQDIDGSTGYKNCDFDEAMTNNSYPFYTRTFGLSSYGQYDYKESKRFGGTIKIAKCPTYGDLSQAKLQYSTDKLSWTNLDLSGASVSGSNPVYATGSHSGGALSNFAADGTFDYSAFGTGSTVMVIGATVIGIPVYTARYVRYYAMASDHAGGLDDGYGVFTPYLKPLTINATGTAIQNTNTVGSAKTKVGGTMLYKDNAGTNTLGTDLKIYFTCNGGSNWTEASSYSAITPVYSTGIKQVRLGETTCTSGTDIRYKAVWANQASGSKEAQLHGIGVNY